MVKNIKKAFDIPKDTKKIKKVLVAKQIKNPKSSFSKKILKFLSKKSVKKAVKGKKIKPKIVKKKKEGSAYIKLSKASANPIISPGNYSWESKATFNPTAFEHGGKIYIIYRAVGEDDASVLGYASSFDGIEIDEKPTYCIYKRFSKFTESKIPNNYTSGGGWNGGCEDPRIVHIDDTLYMIYTAFDGWGSVRMALTSIKFEDFKKKKWNWKKAVPISPPNEINKNWVLFSEKINGKFAILHSFYPKILISYFDSLDELDGNKFIKSNNTRPIDYNRTWDSWFRGVGPAPIKTKDGWLVLYHAMDHKNPDRYRLGALLLDLKDPSKILYRSTEPILEPEEQYENEGHKWGVVYSCGAVVKDGELFVYYGGADKFVCVASISLNDLLEELKKDKSIKLTVLKNKKI